MSRATLGRSRQPHESIPLPRSRTQILLGYQCRSTIRVVTFTSCSSLDNDVAGFGLPQASALGIRSEFPSRQTTNNGPTSTLLTAAAGSWRRLHILPRAPFRARFQGHIIISLRSCFRWPRVGRRSQDRADTLPRPRG